MYIMCDMINTFLCIWSFMVQHYDSHSMHIMYYPLLSTIIHHYPLSNTIEHYKTLWKTLLNTMKNTILDDIIKPQQVIHGAILPQTNSTSPGPFGRRTAMRSPQVKCRRFRRCRRRVARRFTSPSRGSWFRTHRPMVPDLWYVTCMVMNGGHVMVI